jgi:hypothetical protein
LLERFLLREWVPGRQGDDGLEMKIYILMMLIAAIVGLSHLPVRFWAKQSAPVPPDSVPA